MISRPLRSLLLNFLLAAAASADTIQIGTGTDNTPYVPTYGWYNFSWSDALCLKEEIGDTCVITGLSYYVTNEPYEYAMPDQRIYLLETARTSFDSDAYEDPAVSGATCVFDGTVTWNGSGWNSIPLDIPFEYSGEANLVIHWENRDGSYASGYPRFAYTWKSSRAKFNSSDSAFPTGGYPSIVGNVPNVILHCSSIGSGIATEPQPADGAPAALRDAAPTLAWKNPAAALFNAVYFSKNVNDVAATNPAARVLYDGATVFSNYTHGTALEPGTTYYWGVLEQLERGPVLNTPFSFTTEPLPQAGFPWTAGFEAGGERPAFWYDTFVAGTSSWAFTQGGLNGTPAAAYRGAFNARFGGGPVGAKTRLVAPVLDLGGATDPVVTFMLAQPSSGGAADALRVYCRTSPTNDWTLVTGGAFTAPLADWTRATLPLPPLAGTCYLAFEGTCNGGGGVCLDDVSVLTAHGTVTLQVFDCYGDPLAAAPCGVFVPEDDATPFDRGLTDASGFFTVEGVAAGSAGLLVDESFHNPFTATVSLSGGGSATQRIDLAAAIHLGGVVREGADTGTRIEGAAVTLTTPAPESAPVSAATTDAFGQYRLPRIPAGSYRLEVAQPGYAPAATDVVVTASAAHTLVMQPLTPKPFDVYVQVHCALSGLPVDGTAVALEVRDSVGHLLYTGTSVADGSGNLCFRGVPAGNARFDCNFPGAHRRGWWERYTSEADQAVANSKLVNIRLKPRKGTLGVALDFSPTDGWGQPIPAAPYVQNFWIEARGVDPVTGSELYPARTELSDHEGRVTFTELPALPTRITVRRPGFTPVSTVVVPDANAVFPALVQMSRPPLAPNTVWNLTFDQDLLQWLPPGESSAPYVNVQGLPAGNSEGYFDEYRHHLVGNHANPFPVLTSHGQMSAWGQSRYQLTPGYEGYIMADEDQEGFMLGFDFPPQIVPVAEGAASAHTIRATYRPARVWGTLFAADEVNEDGLPVYRPVPNREVEFVLHEAFRHLFKGGFELRTATTDTNGFYALTLPPGVYGLKIPQMTDYWGCKVDSESVAGWGGMDGAWPYAETNNWSSFATDTSVYDGDGLPVNSDAAFKLDLYVNRNRYVVRSVVNEISPVHDRLLYRAPNAATTAFLPVKDLLESSVVLSLSNGAEAAVRPTANGGMHAVWTNLAAGTFTLAGDDHDYLSSTTSVTCAAFAWGGYPGEPPATEPPYAGTLTRTPLPMQLFSMASPWYQSDTSVTSPPMVTVTYTEWNGFEYVVLTAEVEPSYVEYTALPGRVYTTDHVDRSRALTYYIEFMLGNGNQNVYAVPGGGPYAVNTIGGTPASLPQAPFTLNVVARASDNPAEAIEGCPFLSDYSDKHTAPFTFSGITATPQIDWDGDAPAAWQRGSIVYTVVPSNTPLTVQATLYCRPKISVQGSVLNAASGHPVANAVVSLLRADGLSSSPLNYKTGAGGQFTFNHAYSRQAHLLKIDAPGYYPYRRRFVLGDAIALTNSSAFVAALGSVSLEPATSVVQNITWNRAGSVLHGVEAAGQGKSEATDAALTLTVGAEGVIPAQTFSLQNYDTAPGTPAPVETRGWQDAFTELWVVDARYPDAEGQYQPYQPATPEAYFPVNQTCLPPVSDPDKIRAWLDQLSEDGQIFIKTRIAEPASSVTSTGTVSVASLRPGDLAPVVVGLTRQGGYALAVPPDVALHSVSLPRWLAFAADTLAAAASLQSQAADLKATYASNVPDGKFAALPSLSGGITQEDGFLTYAYGLGVQWEEGADAPASGGLSLGPGLLGLQFEANANIGFKGQDRSLLFTVGGEIGKEDVDLNDYAPAFIEKLGIEGEITRVGGNAETTRSVILDEANWKELELSTSVGAYFDLVLRYNLSTITGKLPYVGPFIAAADQANALRMFGRLDAGGRVQAKSTWRTPEPGRAPVVGDPLAEPYVTRPITLRTDDLELTPNRHCFGGQENTSKAYSTEFDLGLRFGAGFEGTALGDHLNVHAGLEITGNENDLVAGQPSLIITPNLFGDWPPIKRAQGDVNAFIRAKLDAYVTEIEKDWTINLARIDHQFTTESLLTMADLTVSVSEKPVASTVFTGVLPTLVRNLPKGSSYALAGPLLAFGRYDQARGATDLVISLANATGYGEPVTVAEGVEGLGKIVLAEIGEETHLLVWEECPGVVANPQAYSVLRSARINGGVCQAPQDAVALHSYLIDFAVFSSTATNSLVYLQSPVRNDAAFTAIRAAAYDAGSDAWGAPATVQTLAAKRDAALACAGWRSPEPGRVVYLPGGDGIESLYWDGSRSSVAGGDAARQVAAAASRQVALCPAGTNETLYLTSLAETGAVALRRYAVDPLRNPLDPAYDWNGRSAAAMWPFVTNLTSLAVPGDLDALANGWLPEAGCLLSVWGRVGGLEGVWFNPATGVATNTTVTRSPGGRYTDLRVIPLSNGWARVCACYTAPGVRELRQFIVEAGQAACGSDADGDGIDDALEQALVDADPQDATDDIRDVVGSGDFDGDGYDNAAEWSAGTNPGLAASRPNFGVGVHAAAALAREDGLLSGSFLVTRADDDPATADLTVHYAVSGTAVAGLDYAALPASCVITAGVSSALVAVRPLADTAVEGLETVVLNLQPGAGYVLGTETQAVVRIRDASRDAWRGEHFTLEERAAPLISGDAADPDVDGIPNDLEYALGLDPRTADPCELALALEGDDAYLSYTYDPAVEDALITIRQATNLAEAVWAPSEGLLLHRETRADQREAVLYRMPLVTDRSFYRLRVEPVAP